MYTRTYKTAAALAALALGWAWTTALSCDAGPQEPGPPALQNCGVTYTPNFPVGGSLNFSRSANCPLRIPGVQRLAYAATADLPQTVAYGFHDFLVVNRVGNTSGAVFDVVWSRVADATLFRSAATST